MTRKEFETLVRMAVPTAQLETDNEGQIIIYTNLMFEDGDEQSVVPFVPND